MRLALTECAPGFGKVCAWLWQQRQRPVESDLNFNSPKLQLPRLTENLRFQEEYSMTTPTSPRPILTPSYRFDLDGLRGIAIALVVFYHVFVGKVSGGVDVFLLLSGYFFLGSQLRYIMRPGASLNPWWPLWRTIRRLLPALAVVVSVSLILVLTLTPQLLNSELIAQIPASLFYYQNWQLVSQDAAYAAAASTTSPLQHLWSMSVQGQFYLCAIALSLGLGALSAIRIQLSAQRALHRAHAQDPTGKTATKTDSSPQALRHKLARIDGSDRPATRRLRVAAAVILTIICISSFSYAARHGLDGSTENYYSTWSRAWQLTLGGLLALYGGAITLRGRLGDIAALVGLAAIFATGIVIDSATAFPGPAALLPIGGAVLIILGGYGSVAALMASRPFRWLGDIAYSLYLWHWPLLIIATVYVGTDTPPWWLGVAVVAVSLILADITYRYVEVPLRQTGPRPKATDLAGRRAIRKFCQDGSASDWGRVGGAVAVTAAVILSLSVGPWHQSRVLAEGRQYIDPVRYPGIMAHYGRPVPPVSEFAPDPTLVGSISPLVISEHCFMNQNDPTDSIYQETYYGEPCIYGDPEAEFTMYLVGGSHAEQWSNVLDELGREMNFKVIPFTRQGCPIELGPVTTVSLPCAQWSENIAEELVKVNADLVFSTTTRPRQDDGRGPDIVPPGYLAFWEKLADNGVPFIGMRDNPWGVQPDGTWVEFDECFVASRDIYGCGTLAEQVYAEVDPAAPLLAQWPNMISVDTAPWFCEPSGACPAVVGNTMVYRDRHHISVAITMSAKELIRKELEPFVARQQVRQQLPDGYRPGDGAGVDPVPPRPTLPYPQAVSEAV